MHQKVKMLKRLTFRFTSRRLIHSKFSHLPIINPSHFEDFENDLRENSYLTEICRALRSIRKERICTDTGLEAWHNIDGEKILLDGFCPDILFVRSFYDRLFALVRKKSKVILLGNPGISKSM